MLLKCVNYLFVQINSELILNANLQNKSVWSKNANEQIFTYIQTM